MKEKYDSGYAALYLYRCRQESASYQSADKTMFKRLLEIDWKFGVSKSEQLFYCLQEIIPPDFLEVFEIILMMANYLFRSFFRF